MKHGMLANRAQTKCPTWVMRCVGRSQFFETRQLSKLGWEFPFKLVVGEIAAKDMPMMSMHRDAGHTQGLETPELAQLNRDVSGQSCVATKDTAANKP